MSHMCIANLLKSEILKLSDDHLMISIDLLDEFTQFVIFDRSGPLLIKRLASIRNYPSIEDMKKINTSSKEEIKNSKNKSKNYHDLSRLDVKVLLREINQSFNNFLNDNNLDKKGKIFLTGRNSQHNNLVKLIGENLNMEVALISPINNQFLKEFSYNPDQVNQFSMSRLIGLGLSLIRNDYLEDQSLNNGFIVNEYILKDDLKEQNKKEIKDNLENKTVANIIDSLNELNKENTKIKEKVKPKTKVEENKKELPPLPNLRKGIEKNSDEKTAKNNQKLNKKVESEVKKNKSFKMDTSFLND